MKSFRDYLNESKLRIYHGDNYGTTKLDTKLMNNGNNQEGIGIYFSDVLQTAKSYGKDVVYLEINQKNYIPSRDLVKNQLKKSDLIKLLTALYDSDNEAFYYFISDYIEVHEVSDVNDVHIRKMVDILSNEQIRNFQIELANNFGVAVFVNAWNKIFKNIHGTYNNNNSNEIWYCVINDKLKLTKE